MDYKAKLEQAIKAADAAGDADAIRVLAEEYRKLPAMPAGAVEFDPEEQQYYDAQGEPVKSTSPVVQKESGMFANLDRLGETAEQGIRDLQTAWGGIKSLGQLKRYQHAERTGSPLAQREKEDLRAGVRPLAEKLLETQQGYNNPAVQAYSDAKTHGEALSALMKDPVEILTHGITRQFPQTAATLLTAAVATLMTGGTGGVLAPAAVSGGFGFGMEFGSSLIDYAAENGVVVTDPASLDKFFSDPVMIEKAIEFATKRSIGTAAGDVIIGGTLGKVLRGPVKGVGKARHVATHGTIAAIGGASGEKLAQVLTGQDKKGQIWAEGTFGGGTTVATGLVVGGGKKEPDEKPSAEDVVANARREASKRVPANIAADAGTFDPDAMTDEEAMDRGEPPYDPQMELQFDANLADVQRPATPVEPVQGPSRTDPDGQQTLDLVPAEYTKTPAQIEDQSIPQDKLSIEVLGVADDEPVWMFPKDEQYGDPEMDLLVSDVEREAEKERYGKLYEGMDDDEYLASVTKDMEQVRDIYDSLGEDEQARLRAIIEDNDNLPNLMLKKAKELVDSLQKASTAAQEGIKQAARTPEQQKRDERNARRRAAYARKKAERAVQLGKADALDNQATSGPMPDPDRAGPAPISPSKTIDTFDPESQVDQTSRERFIDALSKGKRNAPNRNGELSSVLRAVKENFNESTTPENFRLLTDRLIEAVSFIEDLGIHTKVDYVPTEQYTRHFDHDGKKSLGNVSPKTANARRPHGAFIVSLRHDSSNQTSDGMRLVTLLHEALHVATMGIINLVEKGVITDPKIVKAVEDLDALRQQFQGAYWLSQMEGLTDITIIDSASKDVAEFVAYALTSPQMKIFLMETADRRNPVRRMWDTFTKAMLTAIGVDTSRVTMYESTLQAFNQLVKVQLNSPEATKAWLVTYLKDPTDAKQGDVEGHGPIKEFLTPDNVLAMREAVEARWHRFAPDQYVSPYGAFADITRGVETDAVYHGMDEGELFAGQVPQEPNGQTDAPYVLITRPNTPGFHVVVNLPDAALFLGVKNRFPEYDVMTPTEAKHFLESGKTPTQIMGEVRDRDNRQKVEKAIWEVLPARIKERPTLSKEQELLAPFLDIDNLAEAMAKQKLFGKDLKTNVFDFIVSGPNAMAIINGSPILRFVRNRVHEVVKAQAQMARHHVQPMGNIWFAMNDYDRDVAMRLAIEQDHIQRYFTLDELHNAGASSQVIQLLSLTRNATTESITVWNSQRTLLGLDPVPVRDGYFPSLFTGDYRAVVRDADGNMVGVATAATNQGLEAKKKRILEKYPDHVFDKTIRIDMARKNRFGESAWEQIDVIMKFIKSPESQVAAVEFADFLSRLSHEDARHILGYSRHEKTKHGMWGSQGRDPTVDRKENALQAFQALIVYLEDGASHHALIGTLADMAAITTDPQMRLDFPNTVQYVEELYQHLSRRRTPSGGESKQGTFLHGAGNAVDYMIDTVLKTTGVGPNSYRKAQALLRAVFSSSVMGFMNIPFTMLQMAQVLQCGPQMASYLRAATGLGMTTARGRLASTEAMLGVTRYFLDFMSQKQTGHPIQGQDWFGGDPETRRALTYATENNLITLNDLELAHTAMLTPAMRKVDLVINLNQRAAEAATRPFVFLWMYNILKNSNLSEEQRLDVARNGANFVMAEYHATARPMLYQATGTSGPAIGQLKTYAHSYAGQQTFWAQQAFKGNTIAPFLALLATYTLFVGIDGTPGWDELDYLTRKMTGALTGEPIGYKEYLAPHLPDLLKYGVVSAVTGIDFQRRLRMPPLLQEDLMANVPALNWTKDIAGKWRAWT